MDEEGFWVYGAPDRNFGDPDMTYGDTRLTDSTAATAGSNFCTGPGPGPGMDHGGTSAAVAISVRIINHPLFDAAATCHCVSSGFLGTAPPNQLYGVGGIII